jgi:hypothetical protein
MGTFQENNWFPSKVSQIQPRGGANREFAKHMVRFRNPDIKISVDGVFPEIIMFNSHNRSSTFQLMAGLFRFVCENGMIVADSTFETIKTRHSRLAPEIIAEGIRDITEIVPQIAAKTQMMIDFKMSKVDQLQLAHNIIEQVWKDPKVRPLEGTQMLEIRRQEDKGMNLWNTFNTMQENLIKGGLIGTTSSNKKKKMRAITSIETDMRLNKILWEEADKYLLAA